jgi:hypothetical protein
MRQPLGVVFGFGLIRRDHPAITICSLPRRSWIWTKGFFKTIIQKTEFQHLESVGALYPNTFFSTSIISNGFTDSYEHINKAGRPQDFC